MQRNMAGVRDSSLSEARAWTCQGLNLNSRSHVKVVCYLRGIKYTSSGETGKVGPWSWDYLVSQSSLLGEFQTTEGYCHTYKKTYKMVYIWIFMSAHTDSLLFLIMTYLPRLWDVSIHSASIRTSCFVYFCLSIFIFYELTSKIKALQQNFWIE